jgi:hypothetical protein
MLSFNTDPKWQCALVSTSADSAEAFVLIDTIDFNKATVLDLLYFSTLLILNAEATINMRWLNPWISFQH